MSTTWNNFDDTNNSFKGKSVLDTPKKLDVLIIGKLLNGMFTEAMNNNELISSEVIFLEKIEHLVCSLSKEREVLPGLCDAVFGQVRQEVRGGYINGIMHGDSP